MDIEDVVLDNNDSGEDDEASIGDDLENSEELVDNDWEQTNDVDFMNNIDLELDMDDPEFEVELCFTDTDILRAAIRQHSKVYGRDIKFTKNDKFKSRMGCPEEMGRRCLYWSLVEDHRREEPLGPVSLRDRSQLLKEKAACCTGWARGDGRLCRLLCSSVRRMGRYGRRQCRLLCSLGEKARMGGY
ncbi:hypothetical protein CRG98_012320 [Punica granatum]|uniref:Transposase MuDR plant domain-containing protein n=1 Tax=Punica granatum TaxID=22663 RepID=A0A2I0KGL2_PUNGR|nr:hypothetical protein CRG98_012320 [Punica granatum]